MNPYDPSLLHEEELDGRRVVGVRNRLLAAGAALDLIREQGTEPSVEDVARRAGLSQRTVFRLFGDLDQLMNAAVRMQTARITPLLDMPAVAGTRRQRVRQLVSSRALLFEEVTPVRRVAMRHKEDRPAINAALGQLNAYLRWQVERSFAEELEACDGRRREALVSDLDVASSWAVWDSLRANQHLTVKAAEASVARIIEALLLAASGVGAGAGAGAVRRGA